MPPMSHDRLVLSGQQHVEGAEGILVEVVAEQGVAALAQEASRWKVSSHYKLPLGRVLFGDHTDMSIEILEYIKQNFDFMTKDKCVPIEIALKLRDSSSLGLADQDSRFQQVHQELQRSLKAIVNGALFLPKTN